MNRNVVLASTSPYRRRQMETLGIPFVSDAPSYPESPRPGEAPEVLVVRLAEGKARSLAARYPDALIIGADQVAVSGDRVLTKPGSQEAAAEQLLDLAGKWHRLLTGVAVCEASTGRVASELDVAELFVRPLTRELAERYVALDGTADCAGAYKTESVGLALFQEIRCQDPTALVGLPLLRVVRLLERFGFDVLKEACGPGEVRR